ncbi:MAG: ATP-dependent DNA helicase RecG [Thermomicrobiaceae bacterium]
MADATATELTERLELLRKILRLERRKQFDDSAMSGGLEAFVRRSAGEAQQSGNGEAVFNELALALAGYDSLSPDTRAERISNAEQIISSVPGISAIEDPPPPANAPQAKPAPTAAHRPRSPRRQRAVKLNSLDDPVAALPGVGDNRQEQLKALGVRTVRELLYLVPRRHEDYSRLSPINSLRYNGEYTIRGHVTSVQEQQTRNNAKMITVTITDQSGSIPVIFFNPYILNQLYQGVEIAVSGRVERQSGGPCLRNPEWEKLEGESIHTGRLVPFYPLTRGLFQKQVRTLTRRALDSAREHIADPLTPAIRERNNLMDLGSALEALHYPQTGTEHRQARARLAFDEFLVLQYGLLRRKAEWQKQQGQSFPPDPEQVKFFTGSLPFRLTGAQERALNEILEDLERDEPMSRLLQGDVGSGKTVVAAAAAYVVVGHGAQVAILAPTEILAEQHARTFEQIFRQLPSSSRPSAALLTGSTPAARRREIDQGLADGSLDVLIGTHAILEEHVDFQRLGLAIIDEQHRFGVRQRARLRSKGLNPDIMVMTATPIPRSLALVLHGDLDVSIIDELPPGRQKILTRRTSGRKRPEVHQFIREQVQQGRQAFIIYPLVEESERLDVRAATTEAERLDSEVFPDLRVGLLHGRMKPGEKDHVMTQFRDHEIDILVATSVVEVGIDVPNASVMVIEGAERFGLSQLHQFRGRVGRGAAKSYCILVTSDDAESGNSQRRLDAIVETQDGFRLAEVDLELRGPGEFFGMRQSGIPELEFAVLGDMITLNSARTEAQQIIDHDPELDLPEHCELRGAIQRFWIDGMGDLS